MPNEDNIILGLAADNKYAVLAAVLLKSIELNHCQGNNTVEVSFISNSLSKSRQEMLRQSINSEHIKLTFIETQPEHFKKFSGIEKAKKLTAYHRLLLPELLPDSINRLLYLDCDMIVRKSLKLLWNTKLDTGMVIGATRDLSAWTVGCDWGGGIPNWRELGLAKDAPYFNSGVMLVDLAQWRKEKITEKVIKTTIENSGFVKWLDQYGLNIVLHKNWFELDRCWNSYPDNATDETKILHFVNRKPNTIEYNGPFKDEFYKLLDLTAWKGRRPKKIPLLGLLPTKLGYWLRNRLSPW